MATIPPTGGPAAQLGTMVVNLINNSSTLINGQALNTDHLQQRRVKPRSVNSFMAFRSYYSHMFANMPQKFTSTHVKDLWDQDIFKPKWVIIAKAYSIIRGDIGTINAPLDEFLDLICPAIGIINVDQYLEKMKWEAITDADGSITLRQTSVPDYSSFEEHLVFTDMSEWDLIAIAIANGYIPQGAILQNASLIQQGVFPAAAAHQAQQAQQQPQQTQQPQATPQTFANRVDFFRSVATDPVATASVVLGFNVKDMLRITSSQPVEWTGSLADLYDPETGFYDIEHTFEKPFNVGNISEPVGFDNIFSDSIRDGYIIPTVPDFDGENPSYL
ncbi:hypothetical protein OIDMADRAFT_151434 [Oidiodendron maius Zn]|uniref:Alpha box domain-containing protein n=1 Tax=Oidiodendron maius (strain Zn) TaxID=913774 RepID=A0A0C3HZS6_OIDMZ|nr:hypothetical protein OIDMADRAFT_151434 [Oidiodendron maius Zn]